MVDSDESRLHLLGEELGSLREWFVARGLEAFRANQVCEWIYTKDAASFQQMTNLPKSLRTWLSDHADIGRAQVTAESVGGDGTRKLLLTWSDHASVETVWIPDEDRNTACISSQVGCPVGCKFCASGLAGVERNLTAGEIVEQAWRIRRLIAATPPAAPANGVTGTMPAAEASPPRLTNVVLMGMGEPLANYDAVIKAIRILNAPWGLGIGARKITLSTVGLPKQIRRLADEGLQLNLALSLHAPDEKLRQELIPWGKVPLSELLDAGAYYFRRTGREVTLEYVLLDGVNMSQQHAAKLAAISRRLRCNINLLRYNPVPGLPFRRPSAEAAHAFQQELRQHGVNAHIRTSRGQDVDAACGQLRRRTAGEAALRAP